MVKSVLLDESMVFAKKCIDLHKCFIGKHEFVLANQFLKSGTSIGANLREGKFAESKRDFIHKFNIALKECYETLYWLELIRYSGYGKAKEMDEIVRRCNCILRMISASIRTCEKNLKDSE